MHRAFTHCESPGRPRPLRSLTALTALTALSALLLAGCSSSGSTGTSTEGTSRDTSTQDRLGAQSAPGAANSAPDANVPAAKPAGGESVAGAPAAGGVTSKPAEVSKTRAPAVGVGPKLTKNASLDLRVKNIEAAAAKVRAVATGLQAQVLSEQIGRGGPGDPVPLQNGTERSGKGTSGDVSNGSVSSGDVSGVGDFGSLTLSVPANKLDTALDQLTRIGTLLRRNASSQDVTAQYVDTESRLKSMRASVTRVRALMAQAKDLGQVVALEGELSRREAELESLESQLSSLDTNIERSTVTVSLTASGSEEPPGNTGFAAGLRAGWDAFTASAGGLFKAIGTVLPFIGFLALVAAPVVWWLRRRRAASMSPVSGPEVSSSEANK